MAVNTDELSEIDRMLSALDSDAQVFPKLREKFPHLAWTRCDASDVIETPFRSYLRFDIHLLNSADHCSQLTADPASATGIVLARKGSAS